VSTCDRQDFSGYLRRPLAPDWPLKVVLGPPLAPCALFTLTTVRVSNFWGLDPPTEDRHDSKGKSGNPTKSVREMLISVGLEYA